MRIVTLAEATAVQVSVSAVFPLPAEAAGNGGADVATAPRYVVFLADGGRARQVPVVLGARRQRGLDPQQPRAGPAGDCLSAGCGAGRRARQGTQGVSHKMSAKWGSTPAP